MKACSRCGVVFEAKGRQHRCPACNREAARQWYERNRTRARRSRDDWKAANREKFQRAQVENTRKRRAAMKGVPTERFTYDEIYKRDGGICGICTRPVARGAMTLDHRIPVSRGGAHTRSNVQVAHGRCNSRKGARVG